MNTKSRIGMVGGGVLGLAALGYGIYRFTRSRHSRKMDNFQIYECREADVAL